MKLTNTLCLAMNKWASLGKKPYGEHAYSLVEVMMAVGVLGIAVTMLYTGFISGFGSIQTTREELRATQIMTQKLEAFRLLTWSQLPTAPTNFIEYYNPQGLNPTNSTAGAIYFGTIFVGAATNIANSVTYKSTMQLITVSVAWTNFINNSTPIVHTRQLQTLYAKNGLQNYIFGN